MAVHDAGATLGKRLDALVIWALTTLTCALILGGVALLMHESPADPTPLIVTTSYTQPPYVSVVVISSTAPGSDPDFAVAAAIAAATGRRDQRPSRSPLVAKIRQVMLGPLFDVARR